MVYYLKDSECRLVLLIGLIAYISLFSILHNTELTLNHFLQETQIAANTKELN